MDHDVIKNIFIKHLINLLMPILYEGFFSLVPVNYEHEKNINFYLINTLKKKLPMIKQMTNEQLTKETLRIEENTCDYLQELLRAIQKSFFNILDVNEKYKIDININTFIHKCYIESAHLLFNCIELFEINENSGINKFKISKLIEKGIEKSICCLLPMKDILNDYLSEKVINFEKKYDLEELLNKGLGNESDNLSEIPQYIPSNFTNYKKTYTHLSDNNQHNFQNNIQNKNLKNMKNKTENNLKSGIFKNQNTNKINIFNQNNMNQKKINQGDLNQSNLNEIIENHNNLNGNIQNKNNLSQNNLNEIINNEDKINENNFNKNNIDENNINENNFNKNNINKNNINENNSYENNIIENSINENNINENNINNSIISQNLFKTIEMDVKKTKKNKKKITEEDDDEVIDITKNSMDTVNNFLNKHSKE